MLRRTHRVKMSRRAISIEKRRQRHRRKERKLIVREVLDTDLSAQDMIDMEDMEDMELQIENTKEKISLFHNKVRAFKEGAESKLRIVESLITANTFLAGIGLLAGGALHNVVLSLCSMIFPLVIILVLEFKLKTALVGSIELMDKLDINSINDLYEKCLAEN